MKLFTTIIAAALFGLSLNAFAAVSDISTVTHGASAVAKPQVGGSDAFSRTDLSAVTHGSASNTDLSAVTHGSASNEAKQVGRYSENNYRASDITSVTHN
jgi:hypothetical protein